MDTRNKMTNQTILSILLLLLKSKILFIILYKYKVKIRKEIGVDKAQFYAKTKRFLYGLPNNSMIYRKDGEKIFVYSHLQMFQKIML